MRCKLCCLQHTLSPDLQTKCRQRKQMLRTAAAPLSRCSRCSTRPALSSPASSRSSPQRPQSLQHHCQLAPSWHASWQCQAHRVPPNGNARRTPCPRMLPHHSRIRPATARKWNPYPGIRPALARVAAPNQNESDAAAFELHMAASNENGNLLMLLHALAWHIATLEIVVRHARQRLRWPQFKCMQRGN